MWIRHGCGYRPMTLRLRRAISPFMAGKRMSGCFPSSLRRLDRKSTSMKSRPYREPRMPSSLLYRHHRMLLLFPHPFPPRRSSDLYVRESSMMRATARPRSFARLLGVTLLLAACAPAKVLYVDQAWVRLSPNDATPAAGYFTVHGGEEDVRLLSVISPEVLRVELHESIDKNGVLTMQRSEERRVGKACVSKVRFRGSPYH